MEVMIRSWPKRTEVDKKVMYRICGQTEQNEWDDQRLFSYKEPRQIRCIHTYLAKFISMFKNRPDKLDEFTHSAKWKPYRKHTDINTLR